MIRPVERWRTSRVDNEDDVLGDVGGVVADALEVPRHLNHIDAGLDVTAA